MSSDVESVIRAVRGGQAGAAELYPALAEATLLLAVEDGSGSAAAPVVRRWDGVDHGLVFTSPERAAAQRGLPGFAQLTGRDLGARWPRGLRAAVNLGSDDVWIVLDDDAMHAVGAQSHTMPAGQVVAVGAPAQPPAPELVDAIRIAVGQTPGTTAAYLFQQAEPGGTSRLVAGVDLDDGVAADEAVPTLARVVADRYPPAAYLDFVALRGQLRAMVLGAVPAIR